MQPAGLNHEVVHILVITAKMAVNDYRKLFSITISPCYLLEAEDL